MTQKIERDKLLKFFDHLGIPDIKRAVEVVINPGVIKVTRLARHEDGKPIWNSFTQKAETVLEIYPIVDPIDEAS